MNTLCRSCDGGQAVDFMLTMKGIGLQTACILLARLPQLGHLDKGKTATLVSVAPINRDSGTLRGKRVTAGSGQPALNTLFIAALPAICSDSIITAFYHWLGEKVGPGKVADVAVIRKMPIILKSRTKGNYAAAFNI